MARSISSIACSVSRPMPDRNVWISAVRATEGSSCNTCQGSSPSSLVRSRVASCRCSASSATITLKESCPGVRHAAAGRAKSLITRRLRTSSTAISMAAKEMPTTQAPSVSRTELTLASPR